MYATLILLGIIFYLSCKVISLRGKFDDFRISANQRLHQMQLNITLEKISAQIKIAEIQSKMTSKYISPDVKTINLIKLAVNEGASLEESRTAALAACKILSKKIK